MLKTRGVGATYPEVGYFYDNVFGTTTPRATRIDYNDEYTYTSGRYGYPDFPDRTNVGGIFTSYYDRITHSPTEDVTIMTSNGGYPTQLQYKGRLSAYWIDTAHPSGDGSFWGPSAYSKMKPDRPVFSGLNSIYELREVPRMLQQRLSHHALKDASNYWLALQFGWKPLLNDIRKCVSIQMKSQKKFAQLLRDEGKPVRRRILLVDEMLQDQHIISSYEAFQPVLVTQMYDGIPNLRETARHHNRVWASARFRFWLPEGPRDIIWRKKVIAYLYGLYPTPSVVYNMIPWSWLIDWFSNAGDVISNLETDVADRLAADYFYVMREQRHTIETTATGNFIVDTGVGKSSVPLTATAYLTHSLKTRVVGDPFGFGTSESSLSPMQLSILAALGGSRL